MTLINLVPKFENLRVFSRMFADFFQSTSKHRLLKPASFCSEMFTCIGGTEVNFGVMRHQLFFVIIAA